MVPPSAMKAESIIIGTILLNPDKYQEVAGFIPEEDVFYDDRHRLLWRKIGNMLKQGEIVDQITVVENLTDEDSNYGLEAYYITGLTTDSIEKKNLLSYGQIVYKKYLMRKLIRETHHIQKNAYLANGNA